MLQAEVYTHGVWSDIQCCPGYSDGSVKKQVAVQRVGQPNETNIRRVTGSKVDCSPETFDTVVPISQSTPVERGQVEQGPIGTMLQEECNYS